MSFRMMDITLSQLAKCTGLKPRTLQFWTLNGVIRCDSETEHGGPGVPRRYSEDEVAIALVLSEIIRMPVQVGALREIAERFREIMHYGPENGVTDPVHWKINDDGAETMIKINRLRQENKHHEANILSDKYFGLRDWCYLRLALQGVSSVVAPDYKLVPVGELVLELTVDDTGRWVLELRHPDYYFFGEESPPVWSLRLLLNLTRVFARLPSWSEAPETDTNEGEVA